MRLDDGRFLLVRAGALAAIGLAVACAEDVPGVPPPDDQLSYPIGLAVAPGTTSDRDVLLVASSNFDQRYNAGSVAAFSVDDLFAIVDDATGEAPLLSSEFGSGGTHAFRSRVRVPQMGGELVYIERAPGDGLAFLPSRGRNRLSMLRATDGRLDCRTEGAEPLDALDCSEAFVVRTGFDDPFPLAAAPRSGLAGVVAVGHLSAYRDETGGAVGSIALVDVERFEERAVAEASGMALESPVVSQRIADFPGVTGMAFVDAPALGTRIGAFLALNRSGPRLALSALALGQSVDPASGRTSFGLVRSKELVLSSEVQAIEGRGLVTAPLEGDAVRVFATVRLGVREGSYTSAVVVADVGIDGLELRSVLEVGEELGRPFLLERGTGRRLLYVPDIRSDRIWILEASTAHPVVAGVISGRLPRENDDGPYLAHLLDGPAEIAFAVRGDRTLGFVSNFANSTLAVIDVSALDPREHRVVARLGRDIDADGESEVP